VQGRPLGGHLDLGAGSDVGGVHRVVLAVAAQDHRRLGRPTENECGRTARPLRSRTAGTGRCTRTAGRAGSGTAGLGGTPWSAGCGAGTSRSRTGTSGSCGTRALAAAESAGGVEREAPDVAPAHGGVPVGLHLTGRLVERDAVVDAVVDEDEGIRGAADRAVLVADHRSLVGRAAGVVVAPLAFHRREVHRLRIDELRALDGVVGAYAEARVQQPGDRPGLASRVVLVVHERDVLHVVTVVVVLVAADREVRQLRLRQ